MLLWKPPTREDRAENPPSISTKHRTEFRRCMGSRFEAFGKGGKGWELNLLKWCDLYLGRHA